MNNIKVVDWMAAAATTTTNNISKRETDEKDC